MSAEIKIVMIKMETTHRMDFMRSFLDELGSDLDNSLSPFCVIFLNDGDRQDKSYGLGRVVFHRTEPAVAAQAVSV